jgi:hypothetical protein
MKKVTNFSDFKNILPYASEIFGVYQPLLGWKSKRIRKRIERGHTHDQHTLMSQMYHSFDGMYKINTTADRVVESIEFIAPGEYPSAIKPSQSILLNAIARQLPPLASYSDAVWQELLKPEQIQHLLDTVVIPEAMNWYHEVRHQPKMGHAASQQGHAIQALEAKINHESMIAGTLTYLGQQMLYDHLKDMFYDLDLDRLLYIATYLKSKDPFESIDPKKDLDRVGLSPIGIVHLFRQYFFELDTFLGTPVGHVWLSPGATVELIEISTRKTITQKTIEIATESAVRNEQSLTQEDELSDAVKEDNQTDVKFGANVNAHEGWIWGSADQSASFDLNTTQKSAREHSHRQMRQQSVKLSTEIRQNYKSTFRTITEVTDMSSRRYVLANDTDKLVNYELRRKMRQVGVQVQDIGTYLCWQTYVDDPGRQLGVAELVHIAKSPELDSIPQPETVLAPAPIDQSYSISIPFIPVPGQEGDKDEYYADGIETDTDLNEGVTEGILADFPQTVTCAQANYRLTNVTFDTAGADVKLCLRDDGNEKTPLITQAPGSTEATFTVHLSQVNFQGHSSISIVAKLHWEPDDTLLQAVKDKNQENVARFTARVEHEYKKEFVNAAKERIEFASKIEPRKYEELREEERIVVYRMLIQDLLPWPVFSLDPPSDQTRHVVAELVNSIFDVDKMLYFVASDWWKPRIHSHQAFGTLTPSGKLAPDGTPEMVPDTAMILSRENIVGWGGVNEDRLDNYYITEASWPAKLGSSLGWLLQLDGDNLRNAFLNAPWVKAVIPIRPGKEKAAINWLKQVEEMNGIGPNDMYTGMEPDLQGKTMIGALETLAEKVKAKHEKAIQTSEIPDPDDPTNTDNSVYATPVDKVYEHGFYPLQGGFKATVGEDFEVFDQWIEVLPTDQVAAVEVKYDPKTGRQI